MDYYNVNLNVKIYLLSRLSFFGQCILSSLIRLFESSDFIVLLNLTLIESKSYFILNSFNFDLLYAKSKILISNISDFQNESFL
jgi:hypothetical protein